MAEQSYYGFLVLAPYNSPISQYYGSEKENISSRRFFFFSIKQTVMSFHPLNYEYSFHNHSMSIALHVAGLLNPADLAVYLLPYKT